MMVPFASSKLRDGSSNDAAFLTTIAAPMYRMAAEG
jgi:hypothetical protein